MRISDWSSDVCSSDLFEVAATHLGGHAVVPEPSGTQLGRGETVADTARVLSRSVDAIMIRTTKASILLELAQHATVPVINGLTYVTHPCQLMADEIGRAHVCTHVTHAHLACRLL